MESSLFLVVLVFSFVALVNEHNLLCSVTMGVLSVVRPEGVFIVGLYALWMTISYFAKHLSFRKWLVTVTALLFPLIVWVIISWSYYGSPIPQSIIAKRAGVYPLSTKNSILTVARMMSQSVLIMKPSSPYLTVLIAGGIILVFGVGTAYLLWRQPKLWMIPASVLILSLFYGTSKTLIFPHYIALFESMAKICWLAGLYVVGRMLADAFSQTRFRKYVGPAAGLLTLIPSLVFYPWHGSQNFTRNALYPQSVERVSEYHDLALRLRPFLSKDTTVLMPEIGALGFYLDQVKVLDACGLVSPEAILYLPVSAEQRSGPGVGIIPPGMVRQYRPELIIFLEIFGRRGILDDDWFWVIYTPVIIEQGDWLPWESESLYVFARNDSGIRPLLLKLQDR